MNTAALLYRLDQIDNLYYLLCLVREFFTESGMLPVEMDYHGQRLRYDSIEANAVIKGMMDEEEYIRRNRLS